MQELRGLVELLRAADLEQGMEQALRRLVDRVAGGVAIHLDVGEVDGIPEDVADTTYRIVQEAVHNALKHANARNVWIRVERDAERLRLIIADDGRGFPASLTRGVGLDSIAERAADLGGHVELGDRDGGGARVMVEVPCPSRS
jgi:two-component system, NarL family, sensor kinase